MGLIWVLIILCYYVIKKKHTTKIQTACTKNKMYFTSYCLPQKLLFKCTWELWDVLVCSSQTMEFNSNIKKLVMMVEVTNTPDGDRQAEDAHQAMLNITIPPSLKYSAVRRQVKPHRGALAPSSHLHRRKSQRSVISQINCAWLSCKRAILLYFLYSCLFDLGFILYYILLYHFKCIIFTSKIVYL